MVTTLEPPKPLDRVLQYLTNNKIGKIRKETFQGQEHYVVPVAMIVPGVLPGSKGSLYYPKEEIANNHKAWNNIPIVVYHPIINGQPVSAREPEILNTQAIGVVLNARINRVGKLIAEGWFNVELTKKVDNRIYDSLVKGELIELSTGLYTDNHPVENGDNYQGVAYTHIARNYRPDHLAILPDQKVLALSLTVVG